MLKSKPVGTGMTTSRSELGSFIRSRRLALNMSQIQVRELSALSGSSVSMLEIGTRKFLNKAQLIRLASALQCMSDELEKLMPDKNLKKPTTALGKKIRKCRLKLGLSQDVFAQKLGISLAQAKKLEVRTSSSIRKNQVNNLAKVLKLPVSSFSKFVGFEKKASTSELGKLVRSRRKQLMMTIAELATKLGVSPQFVTQIEMGKCNLTTDTKRLKQLSEVLRLDINELNARKLKRRLKQNCLTPTPLSKLLTDRRLQLMLTQSEVSIRAEIRHDVFKRIERGLINPSAIELKKLSQVLECEIPSMPI